MARRWGVGVIGTGFVGRAQVDALRRIPGVEVVALGVSAPSRADAVADLGVASVYADYREVIADPRVDVVHNCTPNYLHFPINKACLEAGKACFSEKPLTVSSAEALELVELAQRSGVLAGVNFNHRGFPQAQEARALIARGELGRIHAVHGGYLQDWLLLETDWNWRVDPALGGPSLVVADIGSHWMDLAQHLTGLRIVDVCADLATTLPSRLAPVGQPRTFEQVDAGQRRQIAVTGEDFASVLVRFDNGARGAFCVSQVSAGRKNRLSLEVDGAAGALAWSSEDSEVLWLGSRVAPERTLRRNPLTATVPGTSRLPAGHAEGWADALYTTIRGFYQALDGEPQPWLASFADGLRAVQLTEAILASHARAAWVRPPAPALVRTAP